MADKSVTSNERALAHKYYGALCLRGPSQDQVFACFHNIVRDYCDGDFDVFVATYKQPLTAEHPWWRRALSRPEEYGLACGAASMNEYAVAYVAYPSLSISARRVMPLGYLGCLTLLTDEALRRQTVDQVLALPETEDLLKRTGQRTPFRRACVAKYEELALARLANATSPQRATAV